MADDSAGEFVVNVDKDLKDLIPMFMENRSSDIGNFKEMLKNDNFDEIEELAHKIKGSGGSYGFDRMTELAREIEKAAECRNEDRIAELIAEFEEHLNKVEIVYE
ncbi:Hpt domain-containing protein [Halarsenatibacter silvermanii]|nr:Hpt domain-containing protein [Halarsenatibacter silvermanii]